MNKKTTEPHLPLFGIPKIWPFLKPYRGAIILMVSLGFLSSLIDAIYPLFNRYALNHFVGGQTLEGIPVFIALYLAVLIFQVLINYKSSFDCGRIEMLTDRDLRNAAFNHLQTLSFSYFNQNSVGYIHARVISDSGKIAGPWRHLEKPILDHDAGHSALFYDLEGNLRLVSHAHDRNHGGETPVILSVREHEEGIEIIWNK